MSSRRESLSGLNSSSETNAGLWLDKFISSVHRTDAESRRNIVKETAEIPTAIIYQRFFERWQMALETQGVKTRTALALGRLVVGMGNESVLETSISLHFTYGVPYIPGSALKGLAADYARHHLEGDEWRLNGSAYRILFGDQESAGYVVFHDALYIPQTDDNSRPLQTDVLTVHHRDYYQTGAQPPADWDSPVPIPFLSATGKYLIALAGPDEWVDAGFQILEMALRELGVGAKTSSGYGRLKLLQPKPPQPEPSPPPPPAQMTETEEEATLESNVNKKRNAQVKLGSGEIIPCSNFPTSAYQQPKKGGRCFVRVTRENEKAVKAVYLR
ncbi:MAG: type III-B CRISPR module RAMP protein Cmr6 [Acidobacteria bacterium]|nr:type III-B CRISPR module RAMP protein Cmr6 [Acidobacteriota bacterium]MCW5971343.1 type III-B CRISPR module RAMP protein Cmr6 [Blastocatellales bacterium]